MTTTNGQPKPPLPATEQQWQEAVNAVLERAAQIADGFTLPPGDVGRLDGRGDEAEAIAEAIRALKGKP